MGSSTVHGGMVGSEAVGDTDGDRVGSEVEGDTDGDMVVSNAVPLLVRCDRPLEKHPTTYTMH